jgi:hypothetical protein
MSFINYESCDYREKYDDGTKIIFKILFEKSFSSTILSIKKKP